MKNTTLAVAAALSVTAVVSLALALGAEVAQETRQGELALFACMEQHHASLTNYHAYWETKRQCGTEVGYAPKP